MASNSSLNPWGQETPSAWDCEEWIGFATQNRSILSLECHPNRVTKKSTENPLVMIKMTLAEE